MIEYRPLTQADADDLRASIAALNRGEQIDLINDTSVYRRNQAGEPRYDVESGSGTDTNLTLEQAIDRVLRNER